MKTTLFVLAIIVLAANANFMDFVLNDIDGTHYGDPSAGCESDEEPV